MKFEDPTSVNTVETPASKVEQPKTNLENDPELVQGLAGEAGLTDAEFSQAQQDFKAESAKQYDAIKQGLEKMSQISPKEIVGASFKELGDMLEKLKANHAELKKSNRKGLLGKIMNLGAPADPQELAVRDNLNRLEIMNQMSQKMDESGIDQMAKFKLLSDYSHGYFDVIKQGTLDKINGKERLASLDVDNPEERDLIIQSKDKTIDMKNALTQELNGVDINTPEYDSIKKDLEKMSYPMNEHNNAIGGRT